MFNLEKYMIPATESVSSRISTTIPIYNEPKAVANNSYSKDCYKQYVSVYKLLSKSGYIKPFGNELTEDTAAQYGNYLKEVFAKLVKTNEFQALIKGNINSRLKQNLSIDTAYDDKSSMFDEWKLYKIEEYKNAFVFDYGIENMTQEDFFHYDIYIESFLGLIARKSLGDNYCAKCYVDDSAIFSITKKKTSVATESGMYDGLAVISENEKLNFFGKEWTVALLNQGYNDSTVIDKNIAINIFKKFTASSKNLSKQIEKEFCRICNDLNNEYPGLTEIPANSIKAYSDIPGLTLGAVTIERLSKTDKNILVLHGGYPFDEEHGWSIAFLNNKWNEKIYDDGGYISAKDFK